MPYEERYIKAEHHMRVDLLIEEQFIKGKHGRIDDWRQGKDGKNYIRYQDGFWLRFWVDEARLYVEELTENPDEALITEP